MTTEKLLKIKDVKKYIPISTASIYNKMNELRFPNTYKFGGSVFWKLSEIQEYIDKGEEYVHQKLIKQKELENVS